MYATFAYFPKEILCAFFYLLPKYYLQPFDCIYVTRNTYALHSMLQI